MKNPYDTLGISHSADVTQLREAYRALAGACGDDPRRMQELNDAYDAIVLSRGSAGRWHCHGQDSGDVDYDDILQQIQTGRYDDALTLLDGLPRNRRGAQWYYLKGCAQRGRGWLEEAESNFEQASRLAPENREYREAFEQMRAGRFGEQGGQQKNDECMKICAGLMCLDCLCKASRC